MNENHYQGDEELSVVLGEASRVNGKMQGNRKKSSQKTHFKTRRSRRLDWQIRQELADAEIEAWKLRDQNREAFRVLQRELDGFLLPNPDKLRWEDDA
jgi:hypothetical protein